jgi:hypothetical protein
MTIDATVFGQSGPEAGCADDEGFQVVAMIRKAVMGFALVSGLAWAGLAATPAEAGRWEHRSGGFSVTIGGHGPYERGWGGHHHGWRERGWHGERGWGGHHRRHGWGHGHAYGGGGRCFPQRVKHWDGWGWVVERRLVCR